MLLLMLGIAAGFYWKITLTDQYNWFGQDGDIAEQVLPWWQFEAHEFHHSRAPLWDPHLWLGQPLLGQGQPGVAYPLNWLLFLTPLRHGLLTITALNWYFVAMHFMAIAFAYALCRDLGRSRGAALFAGCVFGLAGFIGSTAWPQMVNGAVWAPLVLMFLLRADRGQARAVNAALSGGFLGIAWLSGHHQAPLYVTFAVAGVWLFFIFEGRRVRWKVAGLAAISFLAMFVVSGLQTWPAYEYGKLAVRWVGVPNPIGWNERVPYSVDAQYSLPPNTLLGIVIAGVKENGDPFVGVAALTLALAGYALMWRERTVRIFTAIALGGVLLALGAHNVFHGMLYSIAPLFEKARVPAAAILLFQVGLIVPIAAGFDAMLDPEIRSRWKLRVIGGAAVFGVVVWFVLLQAGVANKWKFEFDDRVALAGLFALLVAGILLAGVKGRLAPRHAAAALLILLLIELGNDSGYVFQQNTNHHRYPEKFEANADVAEFLRQQPGPFRVDIDEAELPQNFGDWYDIDVLTGYTASVLSNVFAMEFWTDRDKELFNVAYYISKKPSNAAQVQVFEGVTGIKVYRNAPPLPRAWVVHQATEVSSGPETSRLIQDANFDLRHNVLLRAPKPALAACASDADQVQVARRTSGSVTLDATLACDGMVVVSDSYAPGWTATIDSRDAKIREVDGALRGVVTPAGKHRIEMTYRPGSAVWGAMLTLAGLIGMCAVGVRNARAAR
jgi:Bacterial membrane protein YfhO